MYLGVAVALACGCGCDIEASSGCARILSQSLLSRYLVTVTNTSASFLRASWRIERRRCLSRVRESERERKKRL